MMRWFLFFCSFSILIAMYSCSKNSSKKNHRTEKRDARNPLLQKDNIHNNSRNIIRIRKQGGVYLVPIQINGINLEFIFDTGASDIVISSVEAVFLVKQGKLAQEDIIGQASYQIADGSISTGTVINLKTVKIGNKVLHNVKASVIENMDAPLLLGQSALSQFGRISIDYLKNEIRFED